MKLSLLLACALTLAGCAMSVESDPNDCDPTLDAGAGGASDEPAPEPIRPKKPPTHDTNAPKK